MSQPSLFELAASGTPAHAVKMCAACGLAPTTSSRTDTCAACEAAGIVPQRLTFDAETFTVNINTDPDVILCDDDPYDVEPF